MNEWDALKDEILAILKEHGKAILGKFTGDFEQYAQAIAEEAAKYAAEVLVNPSDEHIRRNLQHLKAQAVMLTGIWQIEAESAALAVFERVIEIVFRVAVRVLVVAAGGLA